MSKLKAAFDAAVALLFVQRLEVPVVLTDLVGRAKFDAWAKLEGMSTNDAKQAYIDLIDELKG